MNKDEFGKFKNLFRAELFSPKGFLLRAAIITIVYWICHVAGLREHTTFLSGTSASGRFEWSVVLGVTYKREVADVRESPAIEIIEKLKELGADVSVCDPYHQVITVGTHDVFTVPLAPDLLRRADLTLILTDHASFDYSMVASNAPLVFDTRNVIQRVLGRVGQNIVRL